MDSYDRWKLEPPEPTTTECKCAWCQQELFFSEEYWDLDDEILCEDCAQSWMESHKGWVSESMARGE